MPGSRSYLNWIPIPIQQLRQSEHNISPWGHEFQFVADRETVLHIHHRPQISRVHDVGAVFIFKRRHEFPRSALFLQQKHAFFRFDIVRSIAGTGFSRLVVKDLQLNISFRTD